MDAMTTERPTIGHNARMTEAEYERERAKIATTKQQAGTRWEQDLAALFYRSGWTKAELIKKEGKTASTINRLLKFGQFLSFLDLDERSSDFKNTLSEGRFNSYWRRVATQRDQTGLHDRTRFREVARLMQQESGEWRRGGATRERRASATAVITECSKRKKWHSLDDIAVVAGVGTRGEAAAIMHNITTNRKHHAKVETKKVGKETHYRIFKHDKTVGMEELTTKLTPILEELEAEGKKNMATMVPAKVAMLTARIKQLLKEWAE